MWNIEATTDYKEGNINLYSNYSASFPEKISATALATNDNGYTE